MMLDKEKVKEYRAFSFFGVGEKFWVFLAICLLMIVSFFVWLDEKPFPYTYAGCVSLFCVWCASHQRKYHLERIFGNEKKTFLDFCNEYYSRTFLGYSAWYFTNDGKPNGNVEHRGIQLYPSVDSAVLVLPLGGWWNKPRMYFRYGDKALPGQHLALINFRIRSYSMDAESVAIDDGQGFVVTMGIYDAIAVLNQYGVRQGNESWRAIFDAMREERKKLQSEHNVTVSKLFDSGVQNEQLAEERDASSREHQATRNKLQEVVADRDARVRTIDEAARSLDEVITSIERTNRLRSTKEGKCVLKTLLSMGIAMFAKDDGPRLRYELMLEGLKRKPARH